MRKPRTVKQRATYRVQELAQATGLSIWSVYRLVAAGTLDTVRPPGARTVLVSRESAERTFGNLSAAIG